MTTQVPDVLINECTEVDFGDLNLYGIATGNIRSNYGRGDLYPFRSQPSPSSESRFSTLWRGYISVYRLEPGGQLILEKYEYPSLGEEQEPEIVNETMVGDFFLIMGVKFGGIRTYVPFRNGRIILDFSKWIVEQI